MAVKNLLNTDVSLPEQGLILFINKQSKQFSTDTQVIFSDLKKFT